jgi:ABC-type dipeptide/oligopeptide/nickel transport system permease subunit
VVCQHHLVDTAFGYCDYLALGKGFWQVFAAVGLTMWVEVARVVRGQVISVKSNM